MGVVVAAWRSASDDTLAFLAMDLIIIIMIIIMQVIKRTYPFCRVLKVLIDTILHWL